MKLPSFLAAAAAAALFAPTVSGQNLLTNGDFETPGLAGWSTFGNAIPANEAPPNVVALSGTGVGVLFGNFSGGFDVSGMFQEFPAVEGDSFTLDAFSRHFSGDALTGTGPADFNWAVMKIAFFDAGDNEIGAAEQIILDGTSPTDTWIDNPSVTGVAPPGTDAVQALILFLQPFNDPGACQVDDVSFTADGGPPPPPATNLLTNGDFETPGLAGWGVFGNAIPANAAPPNVVPLSGTGVGVLFGNFSGGFDVSGMFQEFPAAEGDEFTLDAWSRHFSGDALTGTGPADFNWAVMKIAFFDAGDNEIGAAEQIILDGTSPTDTWIDNPSVTGIAPPGTDAVQALILFLQPFNDPGACQVDDVTFTGGGGTPPPTGGNLVPNGDFETGDFTNWQEFPSGPGQITIGAGNGSPSAGCIDNDVEGSAALIKNLNVGAGVIGNGEEFMISFDAKGSFGPGGVLFCELFTEIAGGGISNSELLGGAPIPLDPDPNVWTTFQFTTNAGPDASGGITIQFAAITGAVAGSFADVCIDNVSLTVGDTPPPPPPTIDGPNLLVNGSFDDGGLAGWDVFGNAFPAADAPPAIEALSGTGIATLFGNFSGGFDVSGIFQEFGAVEGQTYSMDAFSRHFSGDALTGTGPGDFNWAVMKIAFFDAGDNEIGAAEAIILDGTSPTDTWIDNTPISATAPAGTTNVQALILFLQPFNDGGALQVDDVLFTSSGACNIAENGDFETGDFTGWDEFPSGPGAISVVAGNGSAFGARINNTFPASASLIKNSNIGAGTVEAGEEVTISFDAKGSTALGGVLFAELFSEVDGGGVSQSELLFGGAPIALNGDPSVWTNFSFTTTVGPDVSGGITLQLAAITGGDLGSVSDVCIDNVQVTITRLGATWQLYGAGWGGTGGVVPSLILDGVPALGASVDAVLGNSLGAATAAGLIIGDTQVAIDSGLGGTLLVNPVFVYAVGLDAVSGSVALNVPANAALCGAEIYAQSFQIDGGASAGISFSRGLRLILGGE